MPTTHSAYDWLQARAAARPAPAAGAHPLALPPEPAEPEPERHGRAEVERLHKEIEDLVTVSDGTRPRAAIDSALSAVSRLQVVSANLDANKPPQYDQLGRALVELADRQLYGKSDAVERGMTYTADNQMRLLIHE